MKWIGGLMAAGCVLVSGARADEPPIPVGSNLVVDGVPPIPASAADTAGRYTDYRQALFSSWHPTRREMLIATRFGETMQVHRVEFPGGARSQLTFFPDNVFEGLYAPKGGDSFIFPKDRGGDEFFQIYRYGPEAGVIARLTDGKSRNTSPLWSHAGDRLVYGSTRRTGRDVDLYVVEPSDPKTDRLLVKLEGGGWEALDWSQDDRQLLVAEYISANESYFWVLDAATGEKKLLTPKGSQEKIAYHEGKFNKDGTGIYVSTDRESEFRRLALMDISSRRYTYLTSHIPWDVDRFDISPDGKTIAFVTNEDGIGVFHLLDAASGRERPAPKLPAGIIADLKWHPNGEDIGFSLTTPRSPSDAYSINSTSGKVERWTKSETAGVPTDRIREPELVHWTSFDGLKISGFLYEPPKRFAGKRPVIVDIHGGPESQARPRFLGREAYFLNELGCALIFPNIRGSAGYGKGFVKLDNGFLREGAYKDIGALFDWIQTRPDLDAERIMVTGGSYGGHMTLAVATRYSDRIRCAVDVVGMSSLVTFLEHTSEYRRDLRRVEYGDERDPEMRAFLNRIAPLNHVDQIRKPLFVVQGQNDPRVPASEAEQMVAALKKNNVPVWYLLAKDEGHGFVKKKNTDFQFYATVVFVQKFLLN